MPSKTAALPAFAEQSTELRVRLEMSVFALAGGFLRHPSNEALRRALKYRRLSGPAFYKKLLCLVYRIVFMAIIECSGGLFNADTPRLLRARYARDKGIFRFIRLGGIIKVQSQKNIWQSFCDAMQLCRQGSDKLGIAALGALFEESVDDRLLFSCSLPNETLFCVFRYLFWEKGKAGPRYLNILNIRLDELAEAYECLLELHPSIDLDDLMNLRFDVRSLGEHERRGTGSYYTPPEVIARVLDEALSPQLEKAMRAPGAERALLQLRVCDPSCGSGFFLSEAARRIAVELAGARAAPKKPSRAMKAQAFSDVAGRCIYGVDINPMAVELCRMALWMETVRLGFPNTKVFKHIRVANSLLGKVPARSSRRAAARPQKAIKKTIKKTIDFSGQPFEWGDLFPLIFSDKRNGFDVVIGNPPWIAHAGRAVQRMESSLHAFLCAENPAFGGYRTTHGAFVYVAAALLVEGGRLGLVLPTSVADLKGYEPVRRAHDALCDIVEPLTDFGDGAFEGVFQPCMALVSVRRGLFVQPKQARKDRKTKGFMRTPGDIWPLDRNDVSTEDLALLERLSAMSPLPAEIFGERGFQTTPELRKYLIEMDEAGAPFHAPIREGADVSAFFLGKPRLFVNRKALGTKMRPASEYRNVPIVVRQTARYPIAAKNDGHAFRNSLLACFEHRAWPWYVLLSLLNSSLLRWFHYHAFRDARQGMPQVKIGHLRSIPAPRPIEKHIQLKCKMFCLALSKRNLGILESEQDALDALIFDVYGLSGRERRRVLAWARANVKPFR